MSNDSVNTYRAAVGFLTYGGGTVVPGASLIIDPVTHSPVIDKMGRPQWNMPKPSDTVLHFINAAARREVFTKPGVPTHHEVSIFRGLSAEDARHHRAQRKRTIRKAAERRELQRLNEEAERQRHLAEEAKAEWEGMGQ